MSKEQQTAEPLTEEQTQKIPYQESLILLLKTVKSLGINVDIVVLDLILTLNKEVNKKGKDVSLNDIEKISQVVVAKYQQPNQ